MSKFIFLIMVGLSLIFTSCDVLRLDETSKQPKVIYVVIDGVSRDILVDTPTPNIDEIIAKGGFSSAITGGMKGGYSQSPTASAIGYNNLLTGTWANKHNVYTNGIVAPNYNYWSLYRLIKERKPNATTAIFSSWTDNRTKLIGEGSELTGELTIDFIRDGYDLDTLNFPQDSAWVQVIDTYVAKQASEVIYQDSPDFSWVYLWYTDDTGHLFGEDERHRESIMYADSLVGLIYDAVKYREKTYDEDWMVIITTDHGRGLPNGQHHGGQSDREREVWFAVQSNNLNEHFQGNYVQHVDLYPSVARHLDITIPKELSYELDGIPFIGDVENNHISAEWNGTSDSLLITWKSFDESKEDSGILKYSTSNDFSIGGKDEYSVITEINVTNEGYAWHVPDSLLGIGFDFKGEKWLKVVLESTNHSSNTWVKVPKL